MTTTVERRFTPVPVERRGGNDGKRIGGYASIFEKYSQNLGGFVEIVRSSAFNKSRGDGWPDVMARYNHDDNMLLGTSSSGTLKLSIDETGLLYEVEPPASRMDILELVTRGDIRKSSFAFRVPSGGDDWALNEQGFPERSLLSVSLVDVAPVNTPAYLDTSASLRSLAEKVHADPAEVRQLSEAGDLRRFFVRTDKAGKPVTPAKPKLLGASAAVALLARREDPYT